MKPVYKDLSLSNVKSFEAHRCEPVAMGLSLETDPDKYDWDNSKREKFSLFQYTLSGQGVFCAGSKAHHLMPGKAFLVNSPSRTRYHLPSSKTWEFIYILYVGDMARHHTERIIRKHGHILDLPRTSPPVELLFRLYEETCAGKTHDKFSLSETTYRFLMELYRQLEPRDGIPSGIQRAIWHMEQEYQNPLLSLDTVAEKAGLSSFYFTRLFRKHAGVSPYAYLQDFRMNKAMDLLISTGMSVKEISRLTGYSDYSYFCRAFRKQFGTTPNSSRKK